MLDFAFFNILGDFNTPRSRLNVSVPILDAARFIIQEIFALEKMNAGSSGYVSNKHTMKSPFRAPDKIHQSLSHILVLTG